MTSSRRGQIIERGDNRWLVRWYVGRVNNKRTYQSAMIDGTRRQAETALTTHLNDIGSSHAVIPSRKTLGALLDEYLTVVAPAKIKDSTRIVWTRVAKKYVPDVLKARPLSKTTFEAIQAVINKMHQDEYSAGTMKTVRALLSVAFTHAVLTRQVKENPCRYVSIPQTKPREHRIFTAEEVRTFLDAAKQGSPLYHALWSVALQGGLRPSESLALKWDDLDGDTLRIQRTLSMVVGGFAENETKTGKKRVVTLPPEVVEALRIHRTNQVREMLAAGNDFERNDYIFANRHGRPMSHHTVTDRWRAALNAHGLPKTIRLYDARHTSVSLLLAAGVAPKGVADRHGHDMATMMTHYAHSVPGVDRKIAEAMQRIVNG